MKKFFSILCLALISISVFAEEIKIPIVLTPLKPILYPPVTRPRNVVDEVVEASYDTSFGALSVVFNESLGQVTIALQNSMNQTVASYDCNSAMESQVWLPVSLVEGESYTLQIVGFDYEGVGYLVVE